MNKILFFLSLSLMSASAAAEMIGCSLTYSMRGWSFAYAEYRGDGVVSCSNGQWANVAIVSRGAGFTVGKSEIDKGRGIITEVQSIEEVFGTYLFLDGHAGVTKSVEGRVMTKGEVSLVLSGIGRGMDLGVTFGAFSIKPKSSPNNDRGQ